MVRTRAQQRFDTAATQQQSQTTTNSQQPARKNEEQQAGETLPDGPTSEKRKWDDGPRGVEDEPPGQRGPEQEDGTGLELPPTKAARQTESDEPDMAPADDGYGDDDRGGNSSGRSSSAVDESVSSKLRKIIADYGSIPLQGTAVQEPLKPTPETILAMVIDALLKSTRISHELAQLAVNTVIEAGYHDIEKLSNSTWDERVEVLSRGRYNRYREQNATRLGDLAEWVIGEYGMSISIDRSSTGRHIKCSVY